MRLKSLSCSILASLSLFFFQSILETSATLSETGPLQTINIPESATAPVAIATIVVNTDQPTGLSISSSSANFSISISPSGSPATGQNVNSDAAAGDKAATISLLTLPGAPQYDTNPVTSPVATTTLTITDVNGTMTRNITIDYIANINDETMTNLTITEQGNLTNSTTYTTAEQEFVNDTNIFLIQVDDLDFSDSVSPIITRLQPTFNNTFAVQNCTVTATYPTYQCYVYITQNSILDYERQTEYTLEVTLSDGISSLSQILTVTITNEIDQAPSFEPGNMPATIYLAENVHGEVIASEKVLYQVHGVNNEYNYSTDVLEYILLTTYNNSKGENLFVIDSTTGVISRTTNELSFEDLEPLDTQIHLEVMVNLTTTPNMTITANLTINVTDICEKPVFTNTQTVYLRFDENEPAVLGDLYTAGGTDKAIISGPTSGYDLTVTDPDSPQNGSSVAPGHSEIITFSIAQNADSGLFQLDCDGNNNANVSLDTTTSTYTGRCYVEWAQSLDFETLYQRPTFTINIVANDSCGATAEYPITINVRNDNDNIPVFTDTGSYDVTIPENSVRGDFVTQVSAYDPDADPSTSITYTINTHSSPTDSISGDYYFRIETVTEPTTHGTTQVGKIYLYYPWDRDLLGNTATLQVWATDYHPSTESYASTFTRRRSNSHLVYVTFSDVNDNRPIIHTFWNREIPYNEASGFDLGIDLANNVSSSTRNDLGVNNDFEFRFLAPSLYFSIDAVLGTISKSNYVLIPQKRYDVFVISYDLGTDPETKYSPMGIVRIDSYERDKIHVVFHMTVTSAYFEANQNRFLLSMNDVFNSTGWYFRVYNFLNGTSNLEVTIYALTSGITNSVNFLNVTKTYVLKNTLLEVTRQNAQGTPTTTLTNSVGGVLDDFGIVLVEPEVEDPEESENFWLDTELGVVAMIGIIIGGIILIAFIIALVYWLLTREKPPPPPPKPKPVPKPEPKPEPVLKQEYKKQGPGPQILVADDEDEIVARPIKKQKGAEMRGFDAVTGREYIANPITGERNWVENEGDIF